MKPWLTVLVLLMFLSGRAQSPASLYQIYPRSFCDSNGDGIGDLRGIRSKIDYLDSLGVDAVWISPFFDSPQQDFGYDIRDYCRVAEEYGTLEDADSLIAAFHRRGMKIYLDLVLNHTSIEHPWFRDSTKADWYLRRAGNKRHPPNNWRSLTGGSGWHFDTLRRDWYWASFLPFQPDLNWHNAEVKSAMMEVMRFWMRRGVDGFRLDIFNCIYEDAELQNNPFSLRAFPTETNPNGFFQQFRHNLNHPLNYELAKELRSLCDSFSPPRVLIGEVFGPMDTLRKFCGMKDEGLNYVFLFEASQFRFSASFFKKIMLKMEEHFSKPATPVWVFSNHDRTRSMTLLKGDESKARCLAVLQFFARGLSVIYQGEEIGMQNACIPLKEGLDPIAAKFSAMPQCIADMQKHTLNRDNVRTPMLWNEEKNAGFCREDVSPWLPVRELSPYCASVQKQEHALFPLMGLYTALFRFRLRYPDLQNAPQALLTAPSGMLAFERKCSGCTLRIYLNFSNRMKAISLADGGEVLLSNFSVLHPSGEIKMKEHGYLVLRYAP